MPESEHAHRPHRWGRKCRKRSLPASAQVFTEHRHVLSRFLPAAGDMNPMPSRSSGSCPAPPARGHRAPGAQAAGGPSVQSRRAPALHPAAVPQLPRGSNALALPCDPYVLAGALNSRVHSRVPETRRAPSARPPTPRSERPCPQAEWHSCSPWSTWPL